MQPHFPADSWLDTGVSSPTFSTCGKGTSHNKTMSSEPEIREGFVHIAWVEKTPFHSPSWLIQIFCVPFHPSLQTASPGMFLTPEFWAFHFPSILLHLLISLISFKTMVVWTKSFTLKSCFQCSEMQTQESCLPTTARKTLSSISAFKDWMEHGQ